VIKNPPKRGGYSPARGLQNTNPQWVVAPVEKNRKKNIKCNKEKASTDKRWRKRNINLEEKE